MSVRLLAGDNRVTLPTLHAGSAQACITSPPYYSLRDYGTAPLVWGGNREHAHLFASAGVKRRGNLNEGFNHRWNEAWAEGGAQVEARPLDLHQGAFCPCGAWLGSLGLEPSPDLFIEHLVEVFGRVRRVLRDDGVLWLNLGDSYAGSGNGSNDHRQNGKNFRKGVDSISLNADKYRGQKPGAIANLPAKNLMMMPFRVAMALQADGWYLRSVIPWLKRNSMPESVTDRPATSVEYVFLLAKSARYFWDADAVRVAANDWGSRDRSQSRHNIEAFRANGQPPHSGLTNGDFAVTGRNRRNSDWFFESWQGLMLDEQDDPLALVVNPAPFSGAHFATFPPKLVEPMVKASTRPGDTILDPFAGAGTVGLVADRLGRNALLCDLKTEYVDMSNGRITNDAPLFTEVSA